MSDRKESKIKFVSLHGHSTYSIFDGFGYPQEHMDAAFAIGQDAVAITDHGNLNGLSHQFLYLKKMKEDGKQFKNIYGVEAYFIDSLSSWKEEYRLFKENKKNKLREEDETAGTFLEDEEESKSKNKNSINRRCHLLILAQNQTGLNNLYKLVSESYRAENFYRYPRIDFELLRKYNKGLIISQACLGGPLGRLYFEYLAEGEDKVYEKIKNKALQFVDIFKERFFGEIQWNGIPDQHRFNRLMFKLSAEIGLPLITTIDCHYPTKELWQSRELYKRLGWLSLSDRNKPEWTEHLPENIEETRMELCQKNGDQVWDSYRKYSKEVGIQFDDREVLAAIENSYYVAHNLIEDFEPDCSIKFPSFALPSGREENEYLRELCLEGLKIKDLLNKEGYVERLERELEVIKHKGFAKYFLTMYEIIKKLNKVQLLGTARGSAGGSLIAYTLGITQLDPIKFNLQFERFLTKNAEGMPDIDIDCEEPLEFKEFLAKEWGENSVVPVSNFSTLKPRSLIKDISKFFGVPFTEVNEVTSKMLAEATPQAKADHDIRAGVYEPTLEELEKYSASLARFFIRYPKVKEQVKSLSRAIRAISRHASGVCIGEDLDFRMPIISSGGIRQTPWTEGQTVRHLEPMGLIKYDLLGLATLRMFRKTIELVLKRHFGKINPTFEDIVGFYNEHLHPDKIDFTDQKVYRHIYHLGKWAGIFQFTENAVQGFCKQFKPTSLDELCAITSTFRPGPLGAGVDKMYLKAKQDKKSIKYIHPIEKEVTQNTLGYYLYQEQIAEIIHKIGKNVSLDEGNACRKAITKQGTKDTLESKKKLEKYYEKFIAGGIEKGISKGNLDDLWNTLKLFGKYGFNRSHAAGYGAISFQCAWLLTYYPAEFLCAFASKEPEDRKEKAINSIKKLGYEIQSVDINQSEQDWSVSNSNNKVLIQPLFSIKGLGEAAVNQIFSHRPFKTIEELLFNENISYSKLNKRALDVLCRSGALNSLIDERFTGAKHFWSACVVDRPKNIQKLQENIERYAPEGVFTNEEQIINLTELIGMFPFDKLLSKTLEEDLERHKIPSIGKYDKDLAICWFITRDIIEKKTGKGKLYHIVTVIDNTGFSTRLKVWNVQYGNRVRANHLYVGRLDFSSQWGYSIRSLDKLKMLK